VARAPWLPVIVVVALVVVGASAVLVAYEGLIVVSATLAMFRDLWSALFHGG
jgi:hypothetical protein